MSNETKVGILAVIAIAILVWGYKFLKGQNILSTSTFLYVEYDNADMLAVSSPVVINGFQVGVVADMYLKPEDMQTVITVLDINNDVNVPKNAVAELISLDITGGKGINLAFSKPCSGNGCAADGDTLEGRSKGLLKSMVPQEELELYLSQLSGTVGEIYDTLNQRLTDPNAEGIGKSFQDFAATLDNLNATTNKLNLLLARSSGNIESSLKNVESLTGKLDKNMASIDSILDNTARLTAKLNEIDLKKTIENTAENANEAINKLQETLTGADKAIAEVTTLLNGVKAGDGTIGKLFTDDELYYKLSEAGKQIESFLKDLENSPYRYIPLKTRNQINRYDRKDDKEDVD
jgi:phospholipid/cholesterol/gamma-HCH transport system substrate-binding protein